MYEINKLDGHLQAAAGYFRDGTTIVLRSYSTNILYYDTINKTIYCTGLYSSTTRKHIGWFINQFFNGKFNYHDIKAAYNNNYSLFTGGY